MQYIVILPHFLQLLFYLIKVKPLVTLPIHILLCPREIQLNRNIHINNKDTINYWINSKIRMKSNKTYWVWISPQVLVILPIYLQITRLHNPMAIHLTIWIPIITTTTMNVSAPQTKEIITSWCLKSDTDISKTNKNKKITIYKK